MRTINISDKLGFDFVFLLEKWEEDRLHEIEDNIRDAFFYTAYNFDEETNLLNFCKIFDSDFESIEQVEEYIKQEAKIEKKLLIIKNIEHLISKTNKTFVNFINNIKESNIQIIALSKENPYVEELIEGELKPFITSINRRARPNFFDEATDKKFENFVYYSIFGFNERYTKYIDKSKPMKENLINLVLKKDSRFIGEPEKIMKEELRTLQLYNKILQVIAKGAETLNDISDELKMTTSSCNKYINVLVSLKILSKEKSVYESDTRKSKYKINNNLFRFIYYFIPENINEIELEQTESVYNNINLKLDDYLAYSYKEICSDYISKLNKEKKISMEINEDGMWWDKKDEIDIVKGNSLQIIAADCFWNNNLIGKKEYMSLKEKAEKLDVADRRYYIFAKKGFTEELKKIAQEDNDIKLITLDEMFDQKEEKTKRLFFFGKK